MATNIAVTSQQTRFDIAETTTFSGLDIKALNITILPSKSPSNAAASGAAAPTAVEPSKAKGGKRKAAAVAEGLEILTSTNLKLKPGVRYALVGKNGSGKSTLLRAIAEKLIPGMSSSTRVAILQQTSASDSAPNVAGPPDQNEPEQPFLSPHQHHDRSTLLPLARVLTADQSRNTILREFSFLAAAVEKSQNALTPVRSVRQIRLSRLRRQLADVEKNARLRSGARGLQARKELTAFEKQVEEAEGLCKEHDSVIDVATIERETKQALDLWAGLQAQIEGFGSAADAEKSGLIILNGLGFSEAMRNKPFKDLSGGWQMRCLLAETLFQDSDIMILDEPTNFLDLLGIVWLQRFLQERSPSSQDSEGAKHTGRVLIIVSHDRDFVDSVCTETLILRDKELVSFKGTPSAYEADLRSRILYMSRMKEANDKQVKAMGKSISSDMRDAKARGNDNKVRAAKSRQKRMEERTGMQVSSKGTRFKLNRDREGFHHELRGEIEVPTQEKGTGGMLLPQASGLRFPGSLVSLEGVGWRYKAGGPMVFQGLDMVVHMGDQIGIVGLNGCGKTTLVRLITEAGRRPTAGSIKRHPQLKLGYYSQHAVEDLQGLDDPALTALDLMRREAGDMLSEGDIRALLGSLGLPGRTASDVPICKLSGGQLVRLALAKIIWNSPNLLVLDEITTHLDHYTISALMDGLKDYNGALILVSHDRFLIRCVVQGQSMEGDEEDEEEVEDDSRRRVVYLLKAGSLKTLPQGVEDFEASLEKRLAKLALNPT